LFDTNILALCSIQDWLISLIVT